MTKNKSFSAVAAAKKNLKIRKFEISTKELVIAVGENMTVRIPDEDFEEVDARSVLFRCVN